MSKVAYVVLTSSGSKTSVSGVSTISGTSKTTSA
jgi:hypothetical protein